MFALSEMESSWQRHLSCLAFYAKKENIGVYSNRAALRLEVKQNSLCALYWEPEAVVLTCGDKGLSESDSLIGGNCVVSCATLLVHVYFAVLALLITFLFLRCSVYPSAETVSPSLHHVG